eukprot:TRINITY_DN6350_c5_g1_i1.p1 TRINITY_DN6350_c5_g1~~TRINITY_DN6350_c5_g1_i1.p1  ORF type:complete len:585 (-),score=89.40 TRINITY_DN6350_c5_g1_i1:367-2121(-)
MTATHAALRQGWYPFPDVVDQNQGQIVFMTVFYGYMLYLAADLISAGSEHLLLVPKFAPVVGSVVLPVLGAVPDGMMVLFSGTGPNAQEEVSVGVGTLAGSTVMLLTLPWFLAVIYGRVSIVDGKPTYSRPKHAPPSWDKCAPPTPGHSAFLHTGIGLGDDIFENTWMMLKTLGGYLAIQLPGYVYDRQIPPGAVKPADDHEEVIREAKYENVWACTGAVICLLGFVYYVRQEWEKTKSGKSKVEDVITEKAVKAMREGTLTLRGALLAFRDSSWTKIRKTSELEEVLTNQQSVDEVRRMCKLLAPFFATYDVNGDKEIDFDEFRMILNDVNEHMTKDDTATLFSHADIDGSGTINFVEFVACCMSLGTDESVNAGAGKAGKGVPAENETSVVDPTCAGEEEEEEEEEEDMPEDLADLDPEEQQRRLKKRAFLKLFGGCAVVLIFSDPMVEELSAIGTRLNVNPFYVAFVLAPLASNSSELFSAYTYAKRRTLQSITTSLSTLVGAAIMNNTFCLGIFLALIYFDHIAWRFTAETIATMAVELAMAWMILRRSVHTVMDGCIIFTFYFGAIALVWVLENIFLLD